MLHSMKVLPEAAVYESQTVPVFRCEQPRHEGSSMKCGFIFALRMDPVTREGTR